jgi:xanthine dehydrogenase accessory factor
MDEALREAAFGAQPAALVTVARVRGSAPRHPGSRMAVRADGSIVGTVGGGAGEARAREAALAALASGRPAVVEIEMTGAEATGADLICGGVSTMWIVPVADRSPYAAAAAALDRGERILLLESAELGLLAALGEDGAAVAGGTDGLDSAALATAVAEARRSGESALCETVGILCSPCDPPDRLLVLGGGHVGLALARVALGLSFRVSVADPRPEYSGPDRFPPGVACATAPFAEAIASFPSGGSSYLVVVSPGHLGDLECARALLAREYRYAGIIGSRRKVGLLFAQLLAEGFPKEKVEALRAPIGLPIGAETPEEIAISIAAELVAVRRQAASLELFDEERRRRRSE